MGKGEKREGRGAGYGRVKVHFKRESEKTGRTRKTEN